MQRVWAAILAVWALFALVAVLAYARPSASTQSATPQVIVVNTKGKAVGRASVLASKSLVAAHTTTRTS